jgi:hypothetical protein
LLAWTALTAVGPRYRTAHAAAVSVVLIALGNSDKPRSHFDASPTSYPRRRSGNSSETTSTLTQGNGLAKGSDLEVTAERDITPAQFPCATQRTEALITPPLDQLGETWEKIFSQNLSETAPRQPTPTA